MKEKVQGIVLSGKVGQATEVVGDVGLGQATETNRVFERQREKIIRSKL